MTFSATSKERMLSITLALGQYPILSGRIRARMRSELFERGMITSQAFEAEVRDSAIRSQKREGLGDPFGQEATELWELRMSRMRDQLTDLHFSQHLTFEVFEQLLNEVLGEHGLDVSGVMLSLNPELAPTEMVFEQAMTIERLPAEQKDKYAARLQESIVVLIRSLISDQLRYINIAKDWFTISDLAEIRRRKIGSGRIGGKAAGMLLAARILREAGGEELLGCLDVPESYYVGSDELYTFMAINNLFHWNDQKYKTEEEMRADYPAIVADFEAGAFPPDILERLQTLLASVGKAPLIVRSSSLLEDSFGTSFAGKYDSIFLPNQGSPLENLQALTRAIARVYACTLNPDALLYRRNKGLADYDERMAILIQMVVGEQHGRYFMPDAAGVAFSRNLYRWAPQIHREDGFIRLVWGLGTRAVDRVGNDFPRLVALSHPLLRPSSDPRAVRRYSQQYVDLIDLEANSFTTLPAAEVLTGDYPPLRYIAQVEEEGDFLPVRTRAQVSDPRQLVLTFDELLRRTNFAKSMRGILKILERAYRSPVDMEFAVDLHGDSDDQNICITVLQCRPQSFLLDAEQVSLPINLDPEDIVFSTHFMVPEGRVDQVDYVLYVPPQAYFELTSENDRRALARAIGRLNVALVGHRYIAVGPGRWGSSNSDLGVPIAYGDIYHARALVELAGASFMPAPEPSLGTHFFQDLIESQIFPLALMLDDPTSVFNKAFFEEMPDHSADFISVEPTIDPALRLIKVADFRPNHHLTLIMSDEKSRAVALLSETGKNGI
jgi:hypothetical protein